MDSYQDETLFSWDEYYADNALNDIREGEIEKTTDMLEKMTDVQLLDYLCKQGKKLDTLDTFKTYTIAKRLKDNGWTPTKKQREALINTAAVALNP